MKFKYSKLALAVLMAAGVSACGGSDSSSSADNFTPSPAPDNTASVSSYSVDVVVLDADLNKAVGAKVCVDTNSDGACDTETVTTNDAGKATVTLSADDFANQEEVSVVAVTRNKQNLANRLAKPAVSTSSVDVNPVTTIVTNYADQAKTDFRTAAQNLANDLGVPLEELEDTTNENVANPDNSTATAVFASYVTQMNITIDASNATSFNNQLNQISELLKQNKVFQDIVNYLRANGSLDDFEQVTGNEKPVVDFNIEEIGCRKFRFVSTATDPENDPLTFEWDFGDGSDIDTATKVDHTFAENKTYNVVLTVKDVKNTVKKTTVLTVDSAACTQAVTVQFSYANDASDATNATIKFTGNVSGNIAKYVWDFGDGTTSNDANPTHKYEKSGNYDVTLTVTDADGITYDAVSKEVKIVKIDQTTPTNKPPVADFTVTKASWKTRTVEATNNSSDPDGDLLEYTWTASDGYTSHDKDFKHVFADNIEYTITLTVSDGTTSRETKKEVNLHATGAIPELKLILESQSNFDVVLSAGLEVADDLAGEFTWDMGDGSAPLTGDKVSYSYKKAGKYTVIVSTEFDDQTIEKRIDLDIRAATQNNAPVAKFSSSVSDKTVTFTNSSTDADGDELTYVWDFGDGETSTDKNPTHTYKTEETKTYKVKLTVKDGQATDVATDDVQISVHTVTPPDPSNHAPTADFHYEFTGLSGKLTAVASDEDGDALDYTWTLSDGQTATGSSASVKFAKGGSYDITLAVSDGKSTTEKKYSVTLENVEVVTPTKTGIYYKGEYNNIYIWDSNDKQLAGAWPGAALTTASENSEWKFFDTSAFADSKINFILNNPGQTGDIKGVAATGCYIKNKMVALEDCSLTDSTVSKVTGGCDLGGSEGPGTVITGDIPWGQLDYAEFTSSSDVMVDSAPYIMPTLAPGSYHADQTVTLNLEDAARNKTTGTIYYTLDNTVPTEDSTKYSGPITLADTSTDGLGTAYRLRALVVGSNGMKQEQHFFWFIKKNATVAPATDFRDETIYFVVTARYYDGDESNNYFCRDRYDPTDPSWRGDFAGLIKQLDYIKGMGFTAIWVTPPVENRSGLDYHGYHAYDWFQPDLRLESKGATYFDFIKAAHEHGIKVIQDVVLNHSSNYGIRGQAYIEKIPTKYYIDPAYGKNGIDMGPYQGNIGDYLSYNRCDNDNYVAPVWHRRLCAGDPKAEAEFTVQFANDSISVNNSSTKEIPANYFWSPAVANYLPEKWYHVGYTNNWESVEEVQQRSMAGDCVDLKTESDNVRNYMNAAMKMYIDMGIDAVRIDTLKHMPREDVMAMVHTWQDYKKNMFVFGEALIKGFGDNTPSQLLPWYYTRTGEGKTGDSGISVLDFSLMSTFRDSVTKGSFDNSVQVFTNFEDDYADSTKLVTFFQNHDLTPDNTWSGSGAQHCCEDPLNSALAYNLLWTVRGIPVMYAGDETGVRVGLPPDLTSASDLVKQTGRLYVGDSIDNGYPMIAHITDLNAIRKTSKALQRGKMKVLSGGTPFVFERQYEDERAVVALAGGNSASVTVSGATDGSYVDVVTGQAYTISGGSVNLGEIPAGSMRVLVKGYTGGAVAGKSQYLK